MNYPIVTTETNPLTNQQRLMMWRLREYHQNSPRQAVKRPRSGLPRFTLRRGFLFVAQLAGLALLAAWLYLTVVVAFAVSAPVQESSERCFYNALANETYCRTQGEW